MTGDDMNRCMVALIHSDKSESQCILDKSHLKDDSDHVDEHGHHAPVLVHQSTLDELHALAEYDRKRAEEHEAHEREIDAIVDEITSLLGDDNVVRRRRVRRIIERIY